MEKSVHNRSHILETGSVLFYIMQFGSTQHVLHVRDSVYMFVKPYPVDALTVVIP